MPVYSRQTLRQDLGRFKLRDTYVGTTTGSTGAAGSGYILDAGIADPTLQQDNLFTRTWVKVNGMELRVASLNTFSGAYVTAMTLATVVPSGAAYEHHRKLRPSEKDFQLDRIVEKIWHRQEVPVPVVGGLLFYSIGSGFKVFGAYYLGSPTATLDRGQVALPPGWDIVTTGSGRELRLPNGGAGLLGSGGQIVLDAQVRLSLGAADTATVNIPDEDWVLNGVAARCYQSLVADAPSSEAGKYAAMAQAYGRAFRDGVGAYREQVGSDWRSAFDEYVR